MGARGLANDMNALSRVVQGDARPPTLGVVLPDCNAGVRFHRIVVFEWSGVGLIYGHIRSHECRLDIAVGRVGRESVDVLRGVEVVAIGS